MTSFDRWCYETRKGTTDGRPSMFYQFDYSRIYLVDPTLRVSSWLKLKDLKSGSVLQLSLTFRNINKWVNPYEMTLPLVSRTQRTLLVKNIDNRTIAIIITREFLWRNPLFNTPLEKLYSEVYTVHSKLKVHYEFSENELLILGKTTDFSAFVVSQCVLIIDSVKHSVMDHTGPERPFPSDNYDHVFLSVRLYLIPLFYLTSDWSCRVLTLIHLLLNRPMSLYSQNRTILGSLLPNYKNFS